MFNSLGIFFSNVCTRPYILHTGHCCHLWINALLLNLYSCLYAIINKICKPQVAVFGAHSRGSLFKAAVNARSKGLYSLADRHTDLLYMLECTPRWLDWSGCDNHANCRLIFQRLIPYSKCDTQIRLNRHLRLFFVCLVHLSPLNVFPL